MGRWGLLAGVCTGLLAHAETTHAAKLKLDWVEVHIKPTTAKGVVWDKRGNELPDPRVTVTIGGEQVATCRRLNTLHVRCRIGRVLEVDARTHIVVAVVDMDVLSDENIGTAQRTGIPAERTIMLSTSGQLETATLLASPPLERGGAGASARSLGTADSAQHEQRWSWSPWWYLEARLLGLPCGVFAALLLLYGFRSYFFAPQSAPLGSSQQLIEVIKVRCPGCATLVDEQVTSCPACGASMGGADD